MELEHFVFSTLLLLVASTLALTIFKHLGLGAVLGLLVAGIIVGPYSPGPSITSHVEDVRHFAELGVVLLLFLIGLEMQPSRLWSMRREVFGLGSLQILLTGAAIAVYVSFYQHSVATSILIGLTLALSSTAFVIQLLQERGEIASSHGSAAFAVLLMQDLAVVPLLAVVPILSDTGTLSAKVPLWEQFAIVIGMLGLTWVFGRYVVPIALDYLARQRNREAFFMVSLLAVFLSSWAMHHAGLSMALGAFLMGMLLSGSRYSLQVQAHIEPFKGLLMSLFFVAVGMSIDLQALMANPLIFAQHALVIIAIKVTVLFALALIFGMVKSSAVRMSFLLAQGGEFGFVLFGAAKALHVIDDTTFVVAIGVISLTMLVTPLLVRIGEYLGRWVERHESSDGSLHFSSSHITHEPRVVLGGYGRVGHTVATMLERSGIPFIAFDTEPSRVARGKEENHHVYYGDLGDLELLEAAEIEHVELVVLTVDNPKAALRIVKHIRQEYPHVTIIARAHDLVECAKLMEAGANNVFPEAVESSMRLGANALELLGSPVEDIALLLQGLRNSNYNLVRRD